MNNLPAHAGCSKSEICAMLGKMNHFSILDKCPSSGPLLAECKKVKETTLESLPPGAFIGLACLIALKNRIETR